MQPGLGLRFGALDERTVHLCVDAQRMFAEETDWHTPWLRRILPAIERIAAWQAHRTIFTRFVPAENAGACTGTWRRYYERWPDMTLDRLPAGMVDLLPSLAARVPPARVFDKRTYSPWIEPGFAALLQGTEAIVVTGGETDVCVLATVLGAVDRGYRVVIAADAVCSSADETYDAMVTLYSSRFGEQIEVAPTAEILDAWPATS